MPQGRRGGAVWARWAVLSRRTHPFCRRSWSHWSERRSGWCCSPCCRPRNGWIGWTGSAFPFLPRRAEGCWAASARCLSELFLPRRDGTHRAAGNCLPPPHQAQARWPRRRAAHSCGGGRFQAVQSFSGSAGAARRPGQCSPRRCWYVSAGRIPGTNFPAGCWSAGRNFAGRCCGRYTCRRHAIRRSSGNCPRPRCAARRPQRSVRHQRNRQAVRRPASRSRQFGRCWSVRRPGRRR